MGNEQTLSNIEKTFETLGMVDVSGIKLEDAGYELLDITKLTTDIHVAIQSPAIAYYGSLKKEALRNLNSLKNYYERWSKKCYAKAKESLPTSVKHTVADIEAKVVIDNEQEINEWEERIAQAQKEYDTLESWFEGWRQKSFSLKDCAKTDDEEWYDSSGSMKASGGSAVAFGGPNGRVLTAHEQRVKNVRDLIQRRKQEGAGQTSQG
jgi:hypothetical protein